MSEIDVVETVDTAPADVAEAVDTPSIDDDLSATFDRMQEEPDEPEVPQTPIAKDKPAPTTAKDAKKVPDDIEPPASWTKQSKEEFKNLPTQLKAELRKREDDITRGFQEMGGYKRAVDMISQTVAPYQARLTSLGVDLPTAIGRLLNYDHVLANGTPQQKSQAAQSLMQAYGITPESLQPPEQVYVDPDIQELRQRLSNTEQALSQEKQQLQQRQAEGVKRAVVNEFTEFASDTSNKYFEKVRGDMAQYIRSGMSTNLKDAYNRAMWNNPEVRGELLAEQRAEKVRAERNKSTAAKRTASTNVRSNAVSGNGLNLSIDEDLERVWNSMNVR